MDTHLDAVRAQLPVTEFRAYLNTGSVGPLPRPAQEALMEEAQREYAEGRLSTARFNLLVEAMAELRAAFARLLGADGDEIALTHHTTDGMNVATWGLNWRPGDELVATSVEHYGALLPAYVAAQRFGLDLRVADFGRCEDPEVVLATLDAMLTPRTRLLSISHVSWNTGTRLPMAEIVALAHSRGTLVAVDGAQAAGAIPLDVHALGVDFYAVPGQKWLCGPEGVGALYVRRDRISLLRPTFAGYFTLRDGASMTLSGDFLLADGARRYETGTMFRPGVFAMLACLRWIEQSVGWEWAHARIHQLAHRARGVLGSLPGAMILTPEQHAGLITFAVAELDPVAVVAALEARNILIRYVPFPVTPALRVSTGFYNTEAELLKLRGALEEMINERI